MDQQTSTGNEYNINQQELKIQNLKLALKITNDELQDWAVKGGGKNSFNIIADNLKLLSDI